jgi:hypothetical protein
MTDREKAEKVPNPFVGLGLLKLSPDYSIHIDKTVLEMRDIQVYFVLCFQYFRLAKEEVI